MSFGAPWLAATVGVPELPRSVWSALGPRAQHVCRYLVEDEEPGQAAAKAGKRADPLDTQLSSDFSIAFRDDYSISPELIQAARSAGYGGSGTQYHPWTRADSEATANKFRSSPRL